MRLRVQQGEERSVLERAEARRGLGMECPAALWSEYVAALKQLDAVTKRLWPHYVKAYDSKYRRDCLRRAHRIRKERWARGTITAEDIAKGRAVVVKV